MTSLLSFSLVSLTMIFSSHHAHAGLIRAADHDRGSESVKTPRISGAGTDVAAPRRATDELDLFFGPARGGGGIPAFGFTKTTLISGEFRPTLQTLSARDALERSERYETWRRALGLLVEVNQDDLGRLAAMKVHLVGGSLLVGRNGTGFAWFFLGVGAINALAPAPGNTAWTGTNVILLSPVVWHGLMSLIGRPEYRRGRDLARLFLRNIATAPSESPLVNALAAYDLLEELVARHVNFMRDPAAFPRITRATLLNLARHEPTVRKGWLLRFIQSQNPVVTGDETSKLVSTAESEDRKINPPAVSEPRAPLDLDPGKFLADAQGRPGLWTEPLRELIRELDGEPELRERAQALLRDFESQSVGQIAAKNLARRSAWACEFVLANFRAAFVAKSRWAKESPEP